MRRHHGANLVVMNVGGAPNMTGPSEAAFVVNELVRPNSVIVTHVNEPATVDGKVVAASKTAAFQKAVKVPVHVPLSGRTMEFDGSGRCAVGLLRTAVFDRIQFSPSAAGSRAAKRSCELIARYPIADGPSSQVFIR